MALRLPLLMLMLLLPPQSFDLRDRIVTNTDKIEHIEQDVESLKHGASDVDVETIKRLAILDQSVADIRREIDEVRRTLYEALSGIVLALSAIAFFGLKTMLARRLPAAEE